MRVIIKQKNLSLTPSIRSYIDSKLVRPVKKILKRVAREDLPILEIEIARTTMHHRKGLIFYAEANLSAGKSLIRVEAADIDIHAAIDALKDELVRRLTARKDKETTIERKRARSAKQTLH